MTDTPDGIKATGFLVNRASDGVLASSYSPPMIYGLNERGAWVTILSRGSLEGPLDANGISPTDFVIAPGRRAPFTIEEDSYHRASVARWYPVPQDLYWNTQPECGNPMRDYSSPVHAE